MPFNESLQKAGVLLDLNGVHPPDAGVRVQAGGRRTKVVDGPYPESKELMGGYWMIEVRRAQELEEFPEEVQRAAKF